MNEQTMNDVEAQRPADVFDSDQGSFFRKVDISAFLTTLIVTLGAYVYTLAPTVTLEDSGELAVASDYLGVPHPPGYPIWSLLTWFFQWIFGWVRYHGQPNPAWSVGLASAVFGALACALVALLISRSGSEMLKGMKNITEVLGLKTESLICWVCGVTGGLLFAFSPVLWSQSTIVEVYSLNALFLMLIVVLTYRWMCRPKEDKVLYVTAFIFGLGLTNHQSLLFLLLGLMAAIWFTDRKLFRDFLALGFVVIAGYLFFKVSKMSNPTPEEMRSRNLMIIMGMICAAAPVGLFMIERKLMTEWKRVLIVVFLIGLGISFYAYMPFSSEQNPPINWGYPRTMEGFRHAISRGQYEKINPVTNMKHAIENPAHFPKLLNAIIFNPKDFISVVSQFTWQISLLALVPLGFMFFLKGRMRGWLITTLVTFVSMTVIFIIFQYPKLDVQTLFIGRVQYIQAHAVFAIWIGYGLMFALAYIDTLLKGQKAVSYPICAAVMLLPLAQLHRNAYNEEFIKYVGGCEQNGHDFGWQFGNWQLRGAGGIKDDFEVMYGPEEFEKQWAEYPNPDYPRAMGTNAVFYGGTDPGRFVPTYMIYSAKVRPDVFLITQNALADNTYMSVMRDLYGDEIWIPSQQDSNYAFQKYVEDVKAGRIPPGAAVSFKDGRVSVQGVQGVMMINGILAKMIFDANKHKHDFYVEESYVIPWMYPYLEPHGLIMKINAEPLPNLTPEMVKNDHDFWNWYTARLRSNPKFRRDVVARKTFSKLRSAIAGIYAWRRMYSEAEHAFQQAIELYPLSPEANFRLADIYMQQGKYKEASTLIEEFLVQDPGNDKVKDFLNQINNTQEINVRRQELEAQFNQGQGNINTALELATIYLRMNRQQQFEQMTMGLINNTNLPPEVYLQVGQLYSNAKRMDLLSIALQKYLQRNPGNVRIWIDLAAVQTAIGQTNQAIDSLKRAIDIGGEPVRDIARKDERLQALRASPRFNKLVPPMNQQVTLPFPGM